jgi:hypothetical protein
MIIVRIGPRSSRCLYLDEQQRTPALYDFRVHILLSMLFFGLSLLVYVLDKRARIRALQDGPTA